jgi:type I restriction enzyme S subunit
MSFPRYDGYQDSGLKWLGEVPKHWNLRRLGYFFGERREKVSDRDYQPLSVTKEGIVPQLETAAKTDDGDNRKRVCKGDFVINSRSDRKGSAGLSELDGSVSLISTVLTPQESAHGPYVHHLLRCYPFQEEFYRFGKGIVADLWSTNYTAMSAITLAMPPLKEQLAIASFLDRETAKIDALIAEQQRLIELLQEKRQAVISYAVTKGLNPNAPMKDSGVEWLGEVPEHWEVAQIRRSIQKDRKITYGIVQPGEPDPNGRFMVRGQDYSNGWVSPDLIFRVSPTVEEPYSRSRLLPNDLVMTIVGAGIGNTAKVPDWLDGANLTQTTCRLAVDPGLMNADFIRLVLESHMGRHSVGFYAKGAAQPGLNLEHVKMFLVTCPPLEEQTEIVGRLEKGIRGLEGLMQESMAAAALLLERRSALISAAVTGQIDVRGLATEEEP